MLSGAINQDPSNICSIMLIKVMIVLLQSFIKVRLTKMAMKYEIRMYYDCRYVSSCEASWRLLSFDVQYRMPTVERLSFHLSYYQSIVFEDDDTIDNVLSRHTIGQSMFNGWFDANKNYAVARLLTYIEMPTKFV